MDSGAHQAGAHATNPVHVRAGSAPVGAPGALSQVDQAALAAGHRSRHVATPLAALVVAGLLLAACSARAETQDSAPRPNRDPHPKVLRVGLIPNQSPDRVRAQYEPFRAYLSQQLGLPVELFVATDYSGVVEAMLSNKLDLAYVGGVTYVQARARGDIRPIVTEIDRLTHTPFYTSVIIARADGPIHSLPDLRGRRFAFGDINSTSGSLYPRIMLAAAGYRFSGDPKEAPQGIREIVYSGGHDATALAVQNGTVDAGGLEERILIRLEENGTVQPSRIRILQRSAPIAGYPWAARGALDGPLVSRIIAAFRGITDPDLLKLLRAEGYALVSDGDYQYIREQARRFGLLQK